MRAPGRLLSGAEICVNAYSPPPANARRRALAYEQLPGVVVEAWRYMSVLPEDRDQYLPFAQHGGAKRVELEITHGSRTTT